MQAQDLVLFQAALGLSDPWQVTSVAFDPERKRLDLRVDFAQGARFPCPECERAGCAVKDTEEKTWRHLDFFEHQAYLTARVPRVECPEHKVRLVAVPWARPRSGFTLVFEAVVMAMVGEMPVATLAGLVGESDMRIWRVVHHYVDRAVEAQDLEGVERVGIDETSSAGAGMSTCRCSPTSTSVAECSWSRAAITRRCGRSRCFWRRTAAIPTGSRRSARTLSEAFVKGTLTHLPEAEITFDRYHIKSHLSTAVDEIRREEVKHHRELLATRGTCGSRDPRT